MCATGSEKRVTAFANSAEVAAAWSPDGKMLAYQDEIGATYTLDLASGARKRIAAALFAPSKPSWSADGKTIAIGALKPYTRRFREGTSQILTVDLATGRQTFTEPAPFQSLSTRGEDGPLYSPDGKSVAFVMDSLLWIRPVDANGVPTGTARQVNHEVTDAPTWSGDSKQLLYLSNGKLRIIGADGSNPRSVPMDLTWHKEDTAERTVIHAGRLWDGRGAAERSDVDIVIANGRIESVGPHRDHPAGAKTIDASNLTVIPGLWESHTHEWISGKFYGDRLGRLWLAYGVTELQSQGDPVYRAVETREAFASGPRVGPRYFASGEAIDGERVYYNFMRPTTSDAQLDRELSRARALDYDLLKTYVRLPHEMQKKAMQFAHDILGVGTTSHYMLPGMAYGMDGMTHVSATARLGFAYTRSSGGVQLPGHAQPLRGLGNVRYFDRFRLESALRGRSRHGGRPAPAHAQYAVGPDRPAGQARPRAGPGTGGAGRRSSTPAGRSGHHSRQPSQGDGDARRRSFAAAAPCSSEPIPRWTAWPPRSISACAHRSNTASSPGKPCRPRLCFPPGPSASRRISAPSNPASLPTSRSSRATR